MNIPDEIVTAWLRPRAVPSTANEVESLARDGFKAGAEWARKEALREALGRISKELRVDYGELRMSSRYETADVHALLRQMLKETPND